MRINFNYTDLRSVVDSANLNERSRSRCCEKGSVVRVETLIIAQSVFRKLSDYFSYLQVDHGCHRLHLSLIR